jgi:flavin-dependent dehydrogenase
MVCAIPPLRLKTACAVTADALIVGGGLAGGALATVLAEAGRSVVLLEREAGPHDKVCGEFLSREAVLYLDMLGIDPLALGACRIHSLRLSGGSGVATIRLPFPALSLSRRALDHALLKRAAAAGADIRLGSRVQSLEGAGTAWRARLSSGAEIPGAAAFLATGKHDLRGWPRSDGLQRDLIGFKMHLTLTPDQAALLAGHVELVLFRGGYAGLEPVEDGRANLCLLVRRSRYAALGQSWEALMAAIRTDDEMLAERLDGARPAWDKPLAVFSIPYGHVRRNGDGLWRLGDQAAVIPSFSGDGMSIALHSARLAATYYMRGETARAYQSRMARDVGTAVRAATLLSQLSVHGPGMALIGWGASRLPKIMSSVAAMTRVPSGALRRAGLDVA